MRSCRDRSRLFVIVLAVTSTLLAGPSASADPTPEDKATARTLLSDGRAKMEAKDYEGALKSFQAAHAIMGVPTTGLDLARAQAALGKLVEARETALAVTKTPVLPAEPSVFTRARASATELMTEIAPRIPSLVVIVRGAPADSVPVVTVDDVVIPVAALGLPRKLNPGKHGVEVKLPGYIAARREIDLREMQVLTATIELVIDPNGAPTTAPTVSGAPTGGPTNTASTGQVGLPVPSQTASSTVPTPPVAASRREPVTSRQVPAWSWVSAGIGLVGAGVSIGFFADYVGARQTLMKACPGNVCDPRDYDLESMTALRAHWNRDLGLGMGFGAMALSGLAVAIVGIAAAPVAAKSSVSVRVVPAAGSSSGGVVLTGAF